MKTSLTRSFLGALAATMVCGACAGTFVSGRTILGAGPGLQAADNWWLLTTADVPAAVQSSFIPGIGSPTFDASSTMTVMYQLANVGSTPISFLEQQVELSLVTSWGIFAGWGFTDNGVTVGITENMGDDTLTLGPAMGGVPGFVSGSYRDAITVAPMNSGTPDEALRWTFWPYLEAGLDTSSLLVMTGDAPWIWRNEHIINPITGEEEWGPNPAVPEPAGSALMVAFLLAALAAARRYGPSYLNR